MAMHQKYQENAERMANKLQIELEKTTEELNIAKQETDKVKEEKINIKRLWQASEGAGEWREQRRYSEATATSPVDHPSDRARNTERMREQSPSRSNERSEKRKEHTKSRNSERHERMNEHNETRRRERHVRNEGDREQTVDKERKEYNSDSNDRKIKNVVIIGNSQTSGIDPDKFSQNVKLHKVTKYSIEDVEEWIQSKEAKQMMTIAETVIIHEITNDVKRSSALDCANRMRELIGLIKVTFKECKIVVSLGTPRDDNPMFQQRVDIVNNMLMAEALYDRRVKTVHHRNLLYRGTINSNLFKDDRYHLNKDGTRVLAGNLRCAVERSYARNKR